MKIRFGFVSNSSSASFILNLNEVTVVQLKQFNKILEDISDGWSIGEITNGVLHGWTPMDNGELRDRCDSTGIPIEIFRD